MTTHVATLPMCCAEGQPLGRELASHITNAFIRHHTFKCMHQASHFQMLALQLLQAYSQKHSRNEAPGQVLPTQQNSLPVTQHNCTNAMHRQLSTVCNTKPYGSLVMLVQVHVCTPAGAQYKTTLPGVQTPAPIAVQSSLPVPPTSVQCAARQKSAGAR